MARYYLCAAAISGLLAVVLGAFGAHSLRDQLGADLLAVYQTGVQYHFYHTLGLLAVALLMLQWRESQLLRWSGNLFIAGLVIFSGSLYLLAATGERWLGAVTPVGGVAFIVSWLLLAVFAWKVAR